MPLRMRLIALIGLLLLASVGGGGILVGWRAANSVRTELRAALDVGANTVRNALDGLAHTDDQVAALRHLVSTFNGNRHVRAILVGDRDQPISVSELFAPTPAVPKWFRDLIRDEPGAVRLAVPEAGHGAGAIVLYQRI